MRQSYKPFGSDSTILVGLRVIERVSWWFEQQGQRIAHGMTAKLQLRAGIVTNGRNDGAIVRLTTPIDNCEPDSLFVAENRLNQATRNILGHLPRIIPGL